MGVLEPEATIPRVAVITPAFNAAPYLEQTVRSVLGQSFRAWRYVIVDDGSTDGTLQVATAAARSDGRVRVVTQANAGVCAARNHGYALAAPEAKYLLFLDGDDCLDPTMLAVLVAHLDRYDDVGLVYCGGVAITADGELVGGDGAWGFPRYVSDGWRVRELPADEPDTPFCSLFAAGGVIIPSCTLVRRVAYEAAGGWDEALGQGGEDLDLFWRIALRHRVHYLDQKLVRRRHHDRQASADQRWTAGRLRELYASWYQGARVPHGHGARVQRAWRFRYGRVLPHMWASWGRERLRARDGRRAAVYYGRAAKSLTVYALSHVAPMAWVLRLA